MSEATQTQAVESTATEAAAEVKATKVKAVKTKVAKPKVAKVKAPKLNTTELMQGMVSRVFANGKEVYVVVPSVKTFKAEAVEKLTVRPNKRRTPENRFHWLLHTFVRETQNMKGKHMNVHLLSATDKETMFRDERGHFVTLEKLMAQPDAVKSV